MTARHHHYLSQFYLKGFTKGGTKKSKLSVLDMKLKKKFVTSPRNVGGIRDFNRIEVEGHDPNAVESSLGDFEGKVATAIKNVSESYKFVGEDKDYILNFIALLSSRSPQKREHWRKFNADIAEKMLSMLLKSKETWESQIKQMEEDGYKLPQNVTYESVKDFYKSKKYKIDVPTERQLEMEMISLEAVLPFLYGRNWQLIITTKDIGYFITSDKPVNLMWKNPNDNANPTWYSPGFGFQDTQVYFPLSKEIALLGEFEGKEGTYEGNTNAVSVLNSKKIIFTYKQIYAPDDNFYFLGKNFKMLDGSKLISHFCDIPS